MNSIISKSDKKATGKMLVFDKINELTGHLSLLRNQNKTIGFVPTMGALHGGHLTLVEKAAKENDVVVVSIFVNPTQFNNPDDLKNYPRTPEEDSRLLNEKGVDILFSPPESEMYNLKNGNTELIKLGTIAEVMEGTHRPGHFNGVVQIVSMLFDIVQPHKAYFGEKDFQQLAIIRYMTDKLNYKVEIVACPTVREKSGLAMSSRNLKLSPEEQEEATAISKALFFIKENRQKYSVKEIIQLAIERIESTGKLKVEYLEIADEVTLQEAHDWNQFMNVRCFAAVYCGGVRLIDNVKL